MSGEPIQDLVSAAFKLASLQLRLNAVAVEAALALGRAVSEPHQTFEMDVTDIEVEAAACAIEAKLLHGCELGFQALLRTNFSRDAVREMALAALTAAKAARD